MAFMIGPELSGLFLSLPKVNISLLLYKKNAIWDWGKIPFLIVIQFMFCCVRDLQIFHAFQNKLQFSSYLPIQYIEDRKIAPHQ